MLVMCASLVGTAASAEHDLRNGGMFRVSAAGASVPVDPQVADTDTAWWLEYATAAKLFNYPDKAGPAGTLLQPEVAFNYRISRDGKTYSFTIRRGFRFSDGKPVTGKSFVYAIDRLLDQHLVSPAVEWGQNIFDYFAKGDKLLIKLEKPDPTFLTKLATPFFQATARKLPGSEVKRVRSIKSMPTAGPYAFARADGKVTEIVRNPYWASGPGRHRPRHLAGLSIGWNSTGEADLQPLAADQVEDAARQFGVNKSRFWVKPAPCLSYFAFNNRAGLFASNPSMRKAVNFALDRTSYAGQAGPYAASPWTQILPPGVPGSTTTKPYPVRPDLGKARALAAGHFKDGVIRVVGATAGVRANLTDLRFAPENIIEVDPSAEWDLAKGGACADFPDPYEFLRLVSDEQSPSYLDNGAWLKKIAAAAKLTGAARIKAFGKLDIDIMRKSAPLAPMRTFNNRYLFSDRVDPRSLVYQGIYSNWSIPALALK